MGWLADFFDTSGFPARWHCGSWSAGLGWMHIISDLVIFSAYMAIPLVILAYVRQRREVLFPAVFWIFCAFIFSCGTTHLLDAIIFWHPIYPLAGVVKLLTAIVSAMAVVITVRVMPQALALPGLSSLNRQLQDEIAARTASQHELALRAAELAESRRRLIAAQAAAHVGDWTFDPASRRIEWSDEVFRLYERDPALGPPKDREEIGRLYSAESRANLEAAIQTAMGRPGTPVEVDLELALPSGRMAWLRSTIHATPTEGLATMPLWGTVQDITRQKLGTLADARQRRELERINQQLEQFAYIASHDLIEPLRKVRFFADVLVEESRDALTPTATDALARLTSATTRMNRLVQDLLVFARAGKSLTNPGPVSLDHVLAEAMEVLDGRIQESGAVIEHDPLPEVQGEHVLLVQVMQNLLANALNYRHPQRAPRITITATASAGTALMTVSDNGLGFQREQVGRLFEPFVRLHRGAGNDGTGIGLAICRRIVEVHGGSITAAPNPDVGATFTILLPLPPARPI
jgi:signal transduction histidine kinase